MRIAQICPLTESVPPQLYGGTERIVHWLTEELVGMGHEVVLFASGDSCTSADLVPCCRQALRFDPDVGDAVPYLMLMIDRVRRRADEFDALHFHIDGCHFPLFRDMALRTITTLHGRQDLPGLKALYAGFPEMPLVSISDHQRLPVANANFAGTVHHGLPLGLHSFSPHPNGGYLAFLGRICPEKRVDRAIQIARLAGLPLKIAAKIDKADEDYFQAEIKPLLQTPGVEYIGEIGEAAKTRFLGDALALLFPIDWPEPFGLVLIESMACGTPVIAFRRGSVPELVEDGLTGIIVEDVEEAATGAARTAALDRGSIRRRFEERFSASRMAEDYLRLYKRASFFHLMDIYRSAALGNDIPRPEPALARLQPSRPSANGTIPGFQARDGVAGRPH